MKSSQFSQIMIKRTKTKKQNQNNWILMLMVKYLEHISQAYVPFFFRFNLLKWIIRIYISVIYVFFFQLVSILFTKYAFVRVFGFILQRQHIIRTLHINNYQVKFEIGYYVVLAVAVDVFFCILWVSIVNTF